MTVTRVAPALLTGLGLLAAIAVTGCTSSSPAPAAATPASSSAASSTAAPASAVAAASASPSSSGFQNLAVTTAVRDQLLTAFASAKDIPASDIAGSRPNSVYYGYDPATATYWAEGTYNAKSSDPLSVQVAFQDGAATGFFKQALSGGWQVTVGGEPDNCGERLFYPATVLSAWGLTVSGPSEPSC
jgi:hypothetical protein